jgi:hypothetical protein
LTHREHAQGNFNLRSPDLHTTIGGMKTVRTVTAVLSLAFVIGALLGCGGGGSSSRRSFGAEESAAQPMEDILREAPAPRAGKAAGGAARDDLLAEIADESSGILASTTAPQRPAERKRIYSGFCRLTVDEVEQAKAELTQFAERNGGYVESAYENTIVLRVPAPRFRELFEAILDKGELLYKSIETFDVSDYFRDQEIRLRTAERARQRLYTLLERTDDVEERLEILREIKRLSEEIEGIRLRLESLERQISYSRITVELVPRLPVGRIRKEDIPFAWIASLEPVHGSLPGLRGRANLPLGEDFAILEERRVFRAESSDGTRVRIGSTRNQPHGDEEFWQQALIHHLQPFYKQADPLEAGSLKGVLFTSKDRNPYAYLVAVSVKGGRLYVIEVFFPDLEAKERHLKGIREALDSLEVRPWLW